MGCCKLHSSSEVVVVMFHFYPTPTVRCLDGTFVNRSNSICVGPTLQDERPTLPHKPIHAFSL
jgi:hypothetical protein